MDVQNKYFWANFRRKFGPFFHDSAPDEKIYASPLKIESVPDGKTMVTPLKLVQSRKICIRRQNLNEKL